MFIFDKTYDDRAFFIFNFLFSMSYTYVISFPSSLIHTKSKFACKSWHFKLNIQRHLHKAMVIKSCFVSAGLPRPRFLLFLSNILTASCRSASALIALRNIYIVFPSQSCTLVHLSLCPSGLILKQVVLTSLSLSETHTHAHWSCHTLVISRNWLQ